MTPRSLVWATDLDVLAPDRVLEHRDGYVVVRSPSNPGYFWGNFLLLEGPPGAGDGARWERLFEAEFGGDARIRHRAFGWDDVTGEVGAAPEEFARRGYELEMTVGLIGTREAIRPHPRANRQVTVRPLDAHGGADASFWKQVLELQAASDAPEGVAEARPFAVQRLADLRALIVSRRGAWYVALEPVGGRVVASCGVIVTGTRGRFQLVDTAAAYRRRGISSRLVVEAAHHAAEHHHARQLVIAADANYHALGLYESLGFTPAERVCGVYRGPTSSATP
jgi:ribosomal protein S18 acetylase RimI-like enzyme